MEENEIERKNQVKKESCLVLANRLAPDPKNRPVLFDVCLSCLILKYRLLQLTCDVSDGLLA